MKSDLQKTQHYTTNYQKICNNLLTIIPPTAQLVEPFVGNGDLLNLFPEHSWEIYDIDSKLENCIKQDTLQNPPDYTGKWIITNPPFLAKNHAVDKTLFNKYGYDDLYKIFLKTIIGCEGGIVIIPGNFFCDDGSKKIREEFLSKYRVSFVNFFTYPVFESTSYSVCAFSFSKLENISLLVPFSINEADPIQIVLEKEFGYQIGGRELTNIHNTKSIFSRLVSGRKAKNPTNIYLYASDTKNGKIRLEWKDEQYYGKVSDRMFATLDCEKALTKEEQITLIQKVNSTLFELRNKYDNLLFTNYRDNNRKRVGFEFIYKLCSYCLEKI